MPNARYARGRTYEYKTRNWLLKERGATLVIRAAGSHGPYDLVAFVNGALWLIQVKSGRQPSPAEVREFQEYGIKFALPHYAVPVLLWWKPRDPHPHRLA